MLNVTTATTITYQLGAHVGEGVVVARGREDIGVDSRLGPHHALRIQLPHVSVVLMIEMPAPKMTEDRKINRDTGDHATTKTKMK
jgi:hypothetical protein